MKPSILIRSVGAIAAPMSAVFSNPHGGKSTLFAQGLAGAEVVALDLCIVDAEPDASDDSQWVSVGLALAEDVAVLFLEYPGNYRLRVEASAGAVLVGVY